MRARGGARLSLASRSTGQQEPGSSGGRKPLSCAPREPRQLHSRRLADLPHDLPLSVEAGSPSGVSSEESSRVTPVAVHRRNSWTAEHRTRYKFPLALFSAELPNDSSPRPIGRSSSGADDDAPTRTTRPTPIKRSISDQNLALMRFAGPGMSPLPAEHRARHKFPLALFSAELPDSSSPRPNGPSRVGASTRTTRPIPIKRSLSDQDLALMMEKAAVQRASRPAHLATSGTSSDWGQHRPRGEVALEDVIKNVDMTRPATRVSALNRSWKKTPCEEKVELWLQSSRTLAALAVDCAEGTETSEEVLRKDAARQEEVVGLVCRVLDAIVPQLGRAHARDENANARWGLFESRFPCPLLPSFYVKVFCMHYIALISMRRHCVTSMRRHSPWQPPGSAHIRTHVTLPTAENPGGHALQPCDLDRRPHLSAALQGHVSGGEGAQADEPQYPARAPHRRDACLEIP